MARDIAKANHAIAEAWKREKELVKKGMGTRDWTPDQQRDILATGKVHDADGKAFEGHHMKCVSKYPNFQGEYDNIQFLSRDEHVKAHGGKMQNPTNGYYDYKQEKTTVLFDEDTLIPITPIPLSKLSDEVKAKISEAEEIALDANDSGVANKCSCEEKKPGSNQKPSEQSYKTPPDGMNGAITSEHIIEDFVDTPWDYCSDMDNLEDFDSFLIDYPIEKPTEKRGLIQRIKDGIEDFRYEHPIISGLAEGLIRGGMKGAELYIEYKTESMMNDLYNSYEGDSRSGSRRVGLDNPMRSDDSQSTGNTTTYDDVAPIEPVIPTISNRDESIGMGMPKAPHIRSGHPHHYRYKNEDGEWDYKIIQLKDMRIHKELFDDDSDEEE